ncbi:MAG: PIN domain-containing protein [Methanophagales archaeon]|nr:PIN domain-containing protein [Methanophagales archaeon]
MSIESNKLIFVDTWAWLALSNRKDAHHELAKRSYEEVKAAGYRIVTSDYVLDEVITALFRNVTFANAVQFVESLFAAINGNQIKLERITEARFKVAWSLRKRYQDKPAISFTDLTSFVLMQELWINKVFTGDAHFEEINLGFEILPK